MATCPVCNMSVDEKTAAKATYEGKTYYFCSDDCRTTFLQNPQKYVKQSTAAR